MYVGTYLGVIITYRLVGTYKKITVSYISKNVDLPIIATISQKPMR